MNPEPTFKDGYEAAQKTFPTLESWEKGILLDIKDRAAHPELYKLPEYLLEPMQPLLEDIQTLIEIVDKLRLK